MTIHDHDNQTIQGQEITFSVDTNESAGEPVFPQAEEVDSPSAGEAVGTISSETHADDVSDMATDDHLALTEELTLAGKIEAIIFASPKPMRAVEVHELLLDQGYTLKEVQDVCDQLIEFYRDRAGGIHLKYIKRMGYQFQTTTAAKSLMERQFSSRPRPLSRAALETLAVIAYRQKLTKGVTRAEVEFIRGVDAGSIFKTLVERNLLACTGRKEIPGRPMLFGVTDEFLKVFQLGSINDLPPLESFQTPQDIIEAAEQKITAFEAEQAGVDTEAFIGDEEYTSEVQSSEVYNPLAADAIDYASQRQQRIDTQEGSETPQAKTPVQDAGEAEAPLQMQDDALLEGGESKADLIDVLSEGQVAWAAPEVHTEGRPIQGATIGDAIYSLDSIDDDEWDDITTVQPSETPSNERDETTEMAIPARDSEPPRGGEVDQ
jgi:segregation and condensation protein B